MKFHKLHFKTKQSNKDMDKGTKLKRTTHNKSFINILQIIFMSISLLQFKQLYFIIYLDEMTK